MSGQGIFFPEKLPQTRRFVNLQPLSTKLSLITLLWTSRAGYLEGLGREKPPKALVLSVKASLFAGCLKSSLFLARDGRIQNLFESVDGLEGKYGPTLFKLQPNCKDDPTRLQDLASYLSTAQKWGFELHHPS